MCRAESLSNTRQENGCLLHGNVQLFHDCNHFRRAAQSLSVGVVQFRDQIVVHRFLIPAAHGARIAVVVDHRLRNLQRVKLADCEEQVGSSYGHSLFISHCPKFASFNINICNFCLQSVTECAIIILNTNSSEVRCHTLVACTSSIANWLLSNSDFSDAFGSSRIGGVYDIF